MQRVSVVGIAGSGKTTLGQALGTILEVAAVELDSIVYSRADWSPVPIDELTTRIEQIAGSSRWVIDGYVGRVTENVVWPSADTVVWLDLPRGVVLWQAGRRSIRRILQRERLWGGKRETLGDLLSWSPERSVLRWIWTQHGVRRRQFLAASADPRWASIEFVRLRSRTEIASFLSSVEAR